MNLLLGVSIAMVAGIMNGLFPLPMKVNKLWAWENTWLPFSILSLAVFPWIIAWYTVPHLATAYTHARNTDILMAILCGVMVYTGSLMFGISIVHIGVTLSFALLIGAMIVVGVLAPHLLLHHPLLHSTGGILILAGVVLSMLSVVLGFFASRGKDSMSGNVAPRVRINNSFWSSLAIAGGSLSGLLPAGMAMPWAQHLSRSATNFGGASPWQAGNAVLALILLGGSLPNCGYCVCLLWRNGSYVEYFRCSHYRYWLMTLCMGILYSTSVALWGVAISPSLLGTLGPSVGWALFVAMIVLTSTATGLISGEWKDAAKSSVKQLTASVCVLAGAMVFICCGTYLG